jgi:3-methyladenine DNA glycosylase AlkD
MLTQLRAQADPVRAGNLRRFFKTGPGDYGEGDRFLGLTVPQVRAVAKECREAPLEEIGRLLDSPWHEARLLAVVLLVDRYARADEDERESVYRFYLRRTDRINNWDLVDASAPGIVGRHLLTRSRTVLARLARSQELWERRIAMVATSAFIREGQCDDTLTLATMLLDDEHDLMHKAMGWMLREVGKRDRDVLTGFLDRHATAMPRTALRYAIERFPESLRRHYLSR